MRRLPAEWEPQDGVLIAWPHPEGDWAPILEAVEPEFVAFAEAILEREALLVLCRDADLRERVRALLGGHPRAATRLRLVQIPYDDTWTRDYGPLCVEADGERVLVDFRFDGWGGKYAAGADDEVSAAMAAAGLFGAHRLERADEVLEGGSIESDGSGTLLSTEACLVRAGRNRGLDRAGVEALLAERLGARRFLWLQHGQLLGDDTDGHVDTLARFCSPDTIAHVSCEDRNDPHYRDLSRMVEELAAMRTAEGAPYRLIALPLPAARRDDQGARLPAAYANFLIVNGAVLVPGFGDRNDELARRRLAAAFPDRDVLSLPSAAMVGQYGSLHCLSMQFPAKVLRLDA